jgi:hypothetical protein
MARDSRIRRAAGSVSPRNLRARLPSAAGLGTGGAGCAVPVPLAPRGSLWWPTLPSSSGMSSHRRPWGSCLSRPQTLTGACTDTPTHTYTTLYAQHTHVHNALRATRNTHHTLLSTHSALRATHTTHYSQHTTHKTLHATHTYTTLYTQHTQHSTHATHTPHTALCNQAHTLHTRRTCTPHTTQYLGSDTHTHSLRSHTVDTQRVATAFVVGGLWCPTSMSSCGIASFECSTQQMPRARAQPPPPPLPSPLNFRTISAMSSCAAWLPFSPSLVIQRRGCRRTVCEHKQQQHPLVRAPARGRRWPTHLCAPHHIHRRNGRHDCVCCRWGKPFGSFSACSPSLLPFA